MRSGGWGAGGRRGGYKNHKQPSPTHSSRDSAWGLNSSVKLLNTQFLVNTPWTTLHIRIILYLTKLSERLIYCWRVFSFQFWHKDFWAWYWYLSKLLNKLWQQLPTDKQSLPFILIFNRRCIVCQIYWCPSWQFFHLACVLLQTPDDQVAAPAPCPCLPCQARPPRPRTGRRLRGWKKRGGAGGIISSNFHL